VQNLQREFSSDGGSFRSCKEKKDAATFFGGTFGRGWIKLTRTTSGWTDLLAHAVRKYNVFARKDIK